MVLTAIAVSISIMAAAFITSSKINNAKNLASLVVNTKIPVAYYSFENHLLTSVGRADAGVVSGKPEFVQGFSKRGLKLSKGDSIKAKSSYMDLSPVQAVGRITISFWIKADELNPDYFLIHKLDNKQNGYRGFAVTGNENGIDFWSGGLGGNLWTKCEIDNFIGKWHNIILTTKANDTQKIYVDGNYCAGGKTGSRGIASESDLLIGSPNGFSGIIDELKIWKRELSSEEIRLINGITRGMARKTPVHPFGVHSAGYQTNEVNDLNAGRRVILRNDVLVNNWDSYIPMLDKIVSDTTQDVIFTFVPSDKFNENMEYFMPTGDGLEKWKTAVGRIVERYDGLDNDFGCTIRSEDDCYKPWDNLAPKDPLKLQKHPIHNWQITNEPLKHILSSKTKSLAPINEITTHIREMETIIKKHDPRGRIISGGLTGLHLLAPLDGYYKTPQFEFGDNDCEYLPMAVDQIDKSRKAFLESHKTRTLEFLRQTAPYFDVIDTHIYIPTNPEELNEIMNWLKDSLKKVGIENRPIWSLESASPFYFYPLLGIRRPKHCTNNVLPTDTTIHSEHLIKLFAIGLSNGIDKMFYSSLMPQSEMHTPYERLALLDPYLTVNGIPIKKSAYHTYKIMSEKLTGVESVERVKDGIYIFTFKNKGPVIIAWSPTGDLETIDLSEHFKVKNVNVTHLYTENDNQNNPVRINSEIRSANNIVLNEVPVFVE